MQYLKVQFNSADEFLRELSHQKRGGILRLTTLHSTNHITVVAGAIIEERNPVRWDLLQLRVSWFYPDKEEDVPALEQRALTLANSIAIRAKELNFDVRGGLFILAEK